MHKNVTLKMDGHVLTRARHLAVDEETSLSSWINRLVKREVEQRDDYSSARKIALAHLAKGYRLGGRALTREEAHER